MSRPTGPDPFASLGLPARPGLTDDEVRSAWRRVATACHPDRADGGDPGKFAEAAAAYTVLRTAFGRGEALADLHGGPAPRRRVTQIRLGRRGPRTPPWPARGHTRWRPAFPGFVHRRLVMPVAGVAPRAWRGRPARLGLRLALAAVLSAAAVLLAGSRPAAPALITGALTWLVVTGRHDLAPPRRPRMTFAPPGGTDDPARARAASADWPVSGHNLYGGRKEGR